MSTATPGKSRTGDSLWEKAGVNLDKLVEKIMLSLEYSKQNKGKKICTIKKIGKLAEQFQNSCEACTCSGNNQAGKMPLSKSPSCSR